MLSLCHLDCGVAPALKDRVTEGELNSRAREGFVRQSVNITERHRDPDLSGEAIFIKM